VISLLQCGSAQSTVWIRLYSVVLWSKGARMLAHADTGKPRKRTVTLESVLVATLSQMPQLALYN